MSNSANGQSRTNRRGLLIGASCEFPDLAAVATVAGCGSSLVIADPHTQRGDAFWAAAARARARALRVGRRPDQTMSANRNTESVPRTSTRRSSKSGVAGSFAPERLQHEA